jgi:N4-gp56 family major capsid protein
VLYAGAAVEDDDVTGEVAGDVPASIVTYKNLMRLDKILNDNRTPKQTRVITGSRLIDTKVVQGGRIAYIGSDLSIVIRGMTDLFGNPAFIAIQHYADAGTILNGEIGSVGPFRFIEVPEMLHWAGAGAAVTDNPGYQSTVVGGTDHYDIFPILVVGADSFSTIGFQTDGKTLKFSVLTKMPGNDTADRNDPYGETGFSSIKWYYGILIKRAERLAVIKTVAPI